METENKETRNLLQQEPGQDLGRVENSLHTVRITGLFSKSHNSGTPYRVTPSAGGPFRIVVSGRDRWALEELRKAGAKGCTPIDNPAPRWSAYVFNLRELGVEIETITEPHEGDFPGHHGRYVLRSGVAPDWKGGAQ